MCTVPGYPPLTLDSELQIQNVASKILLFITVFFFILKERCHISLFFSKQQQKNKREFFQVFPIVILTDRLLIVKVLVCELFCFVTSHTIK